VRRTYVDLLLGFCISPSACYAATSEGKSVGSILVNDGELKLVIERRSGDCLPFH
jgi:hypothetical protein